MMKSWIAVAAIITSLAPAIGQAQSLDPNSLNVCTGSKTGNYYFTGNEWLRRVSHDLFRQGEAISTKGALDNLRKLTAGVCAVAPTQADVLTQYMVENPASRDTLSVFKKLYLEYVHILCPTKMGANTLSEFAELKGTRKLIVGEDGSGTAETWRILRQVNDKKYGSIQRDDQPSDITSATTVMDSTDTCMLWVSGLNSGDMVAANQRSLSTPNGKPGLKLLSIDDSAFLKLTGIDGQPLYQTAKITPETPQNNRPGLYNNLINNGWMLSSASVTVLAVPSYMMIRNDYKQAVGREKLSRISTALVDALPTIWARVNPAGQNQ